MASLCEHVFDVVPELAAALSKGHIGVPQANEVARLTSNPRVRDQLDSMASTLLRHAELHSIWRRLLSDRSAARGWDRRSHRTTAGSLATADGFAPADTNPLRS